MPSAAAVARAQRWASGHKQVKIWMTQEEYDALKRDCKQAGLSMADYLRQLINGKE